MDVTAAVDKPVKVATLSQARRSLSEVSAVLDALPDPLGEEVPSEPSERARRAEIKEYARHDQCLSKAASPTEVPECVEIPTTIIAT